MYSTHPAAWLSTIVRPLSEKFGQHLTVSRSGNMVCWGYDGQSAFIELVPDGSLKATFVDVERLDAVCGRAAAAAYRSAVSSYALSAAGGRRMVSDLVDFFSGVREPSFTFIDALPR